MNISSIGVQSFTDIIECNYAFVNKTDLIYRLVNSVNMFVQQVVNRIFNSNTYIISAEVSNDVWLVDIGELDSVSGLLKGEQVIRGVFITQSHFDHIYG